jgi:hypothetical protein
MFLGIEIAQTEDALLILALQNKVYVSEAELDQDFGIPPFHQSLNSIEE